MQKNRNFTTNTIFDNPTHSMCLALTKTDHSKMNGNEEMFYRALFDPIVRPEKRESWEKTWRNWFVTTSDIHDIRKPGKLKGMACNKYIFFDCILS